MNADQSQDVQFRLTKAEKLCQSYRVKLTPLRKTLLQLLYENKAPLTAYELLRLLRKFYPKIEAMSVYRILSFLEKYHLIHRVLSCHAYAACNIPEHQHHPQLLLCEKCNHSEEIETESLKQAMDDISTKYAFFASKKPIEIFGICQACAIKP